MRQNLLVLRSCAWGSGESCAQLCISRVSPAGPPWKTKPIRSNLGTSVKDLFQSSRLGLLEQGRKTDPGFSQTQATAPVTLDSFPGDGKCCVWRSPPGVEDSSKCKSQRTAGYCLFLTVTLWPGMGSTTCSLPAKLEGLCTDGAGGRCTLIKSCAP